MEIPNRMGPALALVSDGWLPEVPVSMLKGGQAQLGDSFAGFVTSARLAGSELRLEILISPTNAQNVHDLFMSGPQAHRNELRVVCRDRLEALIDLSTGARFALNEHHEQKTHRLLTVSSNTWEVSDHEANSASLFVAHTKPFSINFTRNIFLRFNSVNTEQGRVRRRQVAGAWHPATAGKYIWLSFSGRHQEPRSGESIMIILPHHDQECGYIDTDAVVDDIISARLASDYPVSMKCLIGVDDQGRFVSAVSKEPFQMAEPSSILAAAESGRAATEWFGTAVASMRSDANASTWQKHRPIAQALSESTGDSILARLAISRHIVEDHALEESHQRLTFTEEGKEMIERLRQFRITDLSGDDGSWSSVYSLSIFGVKLAYATFARLFGLEGRSAVTTLWRSWPAEETTDRWWRADRIPTANDVVGIQDIEKTFDIDASMFGARWSDFRLPEPPRGPIWDEIDRFLAELNQKTMGMVRGRVVRANHGIFDIRIVGITSRGPGFTLDVLREEGDGSLVSERLMTRVTSAISLSEYLDRLASDPGIRRLVESVLEGEWWARG